MSDGDDIAFDGVMDDIRIRLCAVLGMQISAAYGSGFDSGTTAKVGGIAGTITYTDQNTLTLTVPNAATGPQDIVLTRSDGESYTLENAIVIQ